MRLRICGALSEVSSVEFATLREHLNVADSVLSKHLARLSDAGYVNMRKLSTEGHLRTRVSLTRQGRRAFDAHVAALRQIAGL
jgi:DNA-binding MarR family transcriptional regulator